MYDPVRYGYRHKLLRRLLEPFVASGEAFCARCGKRIRAGELWDLDHEGRDPDRYLGPSHRACNRGTMRHSQVVVTSKRW